MGIEGLTGGNSGPEMDLPTDAPVDDGKILPDLPGLDPEAHTFVVFGTQTCPWCTRTRDFLKALHEHRGDFQIAEVDTNAQPEVYRAVAQKTRHNTVPQIFLDGRFVGGWTELAAAAKAGQIDAYLDGKSWQGLQAKPEKKGWFRRRKQ